VVNAAVGKKNGSQPEERLDLPDTEEEKHEVLVTAEKRCKEPNCPRKTLRLAAQPIQRNIGLRHNWAGKKLSAFVCTGLYEYALELVTCTELDARIHNPRYFASEPCEAIQ